jgi:hypothetical protein
MMGFGQPEPRSMVLTEFADLVGQPFRVDTSPEELEIDLVEAKPLRDQRMADRPPFLLVFRSAPDAMLLAGTYVMKARGFGPDLIYISPTVAPPGDRSGHHFYQAVFN